MSLGQFDLTAEFIKLSSVLCIRQKEELDFLFPLSILSLIPNVQRRATKLQLQLSKG